MTDDRSGHPGRPRPRVSGVVLAAVALLVVALVIALVAAAPMATRWGSMGGAGHHPGHGGGMGPMMGPSSTAETTAQAPLQDAPQLTVQAGEMYFAPDRVEVAAGEPVNLTLDNQGQVFHDLVFAELDVRLTADPGTTTTAGLRIDEPGTYTFACTVRGHAAAGMRGTLVVEAG